MNPTGCFLSEALILAYIKPKSGVQITAWESLVYVPWTKKIVIEKFSAAS